MEERGEEKSATGSMFAGQCDLIFQGGKKGFRRGSHTTGKKKRWGGHYGRSSEGNGNSGGEKSFQTGEKRGEGGYTSS